MKGTDENITPAVLIELQASGCKIPPFIKLEIPGGDILYLSGSDRILSDGTSVTGRVVGYPQLTSKINWYNSNLEDTGFTIELANQPTGTDWETLIEQFGAVDVFTIKVSVIIIIAREQITLFKGFVERLDSYDEKTVTLSVRKGLSHLDTKLGTLITYSFWGYTITSESRGRMLPLIWGKVDFCPARPINRAWEAEVLTDNGHTITANSYEQNCVRPNPLLTENMSMFIGTELIHYTSLSYNETTGILTLTGLTRHYQHTIEAEHTVGERIIAWKAAGDESLIHNYIIAGHDVEELSDVTVNKRTPAALDYLLYPGTYPAIVRSGSWGGKLALIQFTRNPVYPDTTTNTRIKKIYFKEDWGSTGVTGVENICEVTEGNGPLGEGNDPALIVGEGILKVIIKRTPAWSTAAYSLGTIKSAKLIVKSRTKIPETEDGFDATIDPTDSSAKIAMPQSPGLLASTTLDTCKAIGDVITETVYASSANGYTTPQHTGEIAGTVDGWYDPSNIMASAGYAHFYVAPGNVMGTVQIEASFPGWSHVYTTLAEVQIQYKLTSDPRYPFQSFGDLKLYKTTTDEGYVFVVSLNRSSSSTFNKEVNVSLADITKQKSWSIRCHNAAAFYGAYYFDVNWMRMYYEYQPTDYGEIKTQEFDLDISDWSDLDLKYVIIQHLPTADTKDLQIYDCHIEVEYWPYRPFDPFEIACTVNGRKKGDIITGLTHNYEYPGIVMQDIIENWLLEKTNLSDSITIDTEAFEKYWEMSQLDPLDPDYDPIYIDNYVNYRLDKQESILTTLVRLAFENRRWLTFDNLEFGLIRRPDTWTEPDWTITDSDIVRGTFRVTPGSVLDLTTNLDWKAQFNHVDQDWGKVDEAASLTPSTVGEKPMTIELYSHCQSKDPTVPRYYLDMFSETHDMYSFSVRPEGLKVEVGDTLNVTYSPLGISGINIFVLSVGISLGNLMSGEPTTVKITGVV